MSIPFPLALSPSLGLVWVRKEGPSYPLQNVSILCWCVAACDSSNYSGLCETFLFVCEVEATEVTNLCGWLVGILALVITEMYLCNLDKCCLFLLTPPTKIKRKKNSVASFIKTECPSSCFVKHRTLLSATVKIIFAMCCVHALLVLHFLVIQCLFSFGKTWKLLKSFGKTMWLFVNDMKHYINSVPLWLQGMSSTLTWLRRLKIALDAAKGLAFLHGLDRPIIYRDFKTSNILLDSVSGFVVPW